MYLFQPHANDVEAWCRLCFGRVKPPARLGHNPPVSNLEAAIEDNNTDVKMELDREVKLEDREMGEQEKTDSAPTGFPTYEGILPLG